MTTSLLCATNNYADTCKQGWEVTRVQKTIPSLNICSKNKDIKQHTFEDPRFTITYWRTPLRHDTLCSRSFYWYFFVHGRTWAIRLSKQGRHICSTVCVCSKNLKLIEWIQRRVEPSSVINRTKQITLSNLDVRDDKSK